MRFRTTILPAGKTAAGVEVPAKVVAALGTSKRPPVRVTINGHTYRSTVAVMGGKFMLGVSNEVRKEAGVAAGETVDIDIELDPAA
jgi:predicted thioesterase